MIAILVVVGTTIAVTAALCGHQNEPPPWKRRTPRRKA